MLVHYLDNDVNNFLEKKTYFEFKIQYSSQNGPTNKQLTRFYSEHTTHTHKGRNCFFFT